MTTLSKTWVIDINRVPAAQGTAALQQSNMIFNLKQFLTGAVPLNAAGAWTVRGSGNGNGTFGAADNWLTAADVKSNTASGLQHSWLVLRSPSGLLPGSAFVEILIDVFAAGAAQFENFQLTVANSLNPFNIGAGTDTTAPPTPTNGIAFGSRQYIENTVLVNHRNHFWRNTEGDFYLAASRDGSGFNAFSMWCFVGRSGETPDNYPAIIGSSYNNSSPGTPSVAQMQASTNNASWYVDGTVADICPVYPKQDSNNLATSGVPNTGSAVSGRYPSIPIDLWRIQPTKGSYCGRVPDINWSFVNATNLTVEAGSDPIRRLVFDQLSIFTDGPIPIF